jgi:hypothetical protein
MVDTDGTDDGSTDTDGTADGMVDTDGVPDGTADISPGTNDGMTEGSADTSPGTDVLGDPVFSDFLFPPLPLPPFLSFLPFPFLELLDGAADDDGSSVGSIDGSTVGSKEDVGTALPFSEAFFCFFCFFLVLSDSSPLPPFAFPFPWPKTLGDALGSSEGIVDGPMEGPELGASLASTEVAETKNTDPDETLNPMTIASRIGRIAAFTVNIDETSLVLSLMRPCRCRCGPLWIIPSRPKYNFSLSSLLAYVASPRLLRLWVATFFPSEGIL